MISDRWMARATNNSTAGRRITAVARPGSLLKRQHPIQPRDGAREAAGRDLDYLAMVRQLPCIKCGLEPCGTAAHLRMNSGAYNKRQAMAKKPDDSWTTPMCNGCHTNDYDAQHRIGEAEFWRRLGTNPFLLCQRLHAVRGDLVAMRAVVFVAISERSTSPSSPPAGVPVSAAASLAPPPRRVPPPRPSDKPEDGGGPS